MKKKVIIDLHDYNPQLTEIYRVGIRGIIIVNDKLLMIEDASGAVKLPGGGQEEGEDDIATLTREIKEETGFCVMPESVKEFAEIEEKRMSAKEPMIWHQMNRYYMCQVEGIQGECSYSEHEKLYGFHQVWYTIDEALQKTERVIRAKGKHLGSQREYVSLNLIKEYVINGGAKGLDAEKNRE